MTDELESYRAKRTAGATPEPFGRERVERPGAFVVQLHRATRRHWDLRVERSGVLWSWAVPKGPSLDPNEKRLAVHVEDHPVDYADFEGVIPEGNYGAGAVIVWDRGRWIPVEDPEAGLESGKLLFDLEGTKLHGRWTLVRTGGRKSRSKEWLLIKKPDGAVREEPPPDHSIFTGRTVDEVAAGSPRAEAVRRAVARARAPRADLDPAAVDVMLAERSPRPFDGKAWVFEVKHDGFRALVAKQGVDVRILYRSHRDATEAYPEIVAAVRAMPHDHLLLDGEIVANDASGRPSFRALQRRAQLARARDVGRASVTSPVVYWAFDLLAIDGRDVRAQPLERRKAWLRDVVAPTGPVRFSEHFPERGEAVFTEVERLGLEGVVAKRARSPYRAGRSDDWRKIRALRTDDFVVVGFTTPARGRRGFGALHLAAHRPTPDGDVLTWAGRVGSGFSDATLDEVRERLDALAVERPSCAGVPHGRNTTWCAPEVVVEVRFLERGPEGVLRQPTFLRVRDDKAPADCRDVPDPDVPADETAEAIAPTEPSPALVLTNLDKVFWPDEGLTKGDLLAYYRAVGPWLLPWLRDRPLVLTRHPDGIAGKSFYQKDAPSWVPDWVRTETVWSEHAEREIRYFVCDDLDALLYLVNLGAIPLHVWSSRTATLAHPDWCILDLDPKGAPFRDVVRIAREIRTITRAVELPSYVKTSGSTGLHVLVPLGGRLTYDQSRTIAQLLGKLVVARLPEIATLVRTIESRDGKVYVDWLQNRHGQLLAAPYAVRPLPGAPVSMPLRWAEVTAKLDPKAFTIETVPARLRRRRRDPWEGLLDAVPDWLEALARIERSFGNGGA